MVENGRHHCGGVGVGDTEDAHIALHVFNDGRQITRLNAQLRQVRRRTDLVVSALERRYALFATGVEEDEIFHRKSSVTIRDVFR